MKRNNLKWLFLMFLLGGKTLMAQEGEPVIISVIYQFKHINDLNKPYKPYQQEMILRLGKNESRYSNWTNEYKIRESIKRAKTSARTGSVKAVMGMPVAVVKSEGVVDLELFQNTKATKLIKTATLGMQDYLIEGGLPKIEWQISEETKKIATYMCQKAIGAFAGRVYTVWFAPELPFQNGPWKLSGLPGLILEAKDSKNEVFFIFKQLNKGEEGETTASELVSLVKVTEKAYERAKIVYEQDPVRVFQSQIPMNGPKVSIAYVDDNGKYTSGDEARTLIEKNKKDAKLKKNNPIELLKN